MKKLLVAILAFLYISTSTGATLHMHYCMGKLADWDLGHNESKKCGKCGMEKSAEKDNGCCKDEHKFLKNNSDQKTVESAFQVMQVISVSLPVSFFENAPVYFTIIKAANPRSHAPPPDTGTAIYIRNCVFLI